MSEKFVPPPMKRRIKAIRQSETTECGLACLAMIANYWGHDLDLATLRSRYGTSSRGISLRQMMQISDSMGLIPRALKPELDELDKIAMPAILHWDLNHFVVIEKFHRGKAYIVDPGKSSSWHDQKSLSKHFTGVALELRPAPGFEPQTGRRNLKLKQLWSKSSGLIRSGSQIIMLSLVMQAYALASPYLLQISVDQVLPANDADFLAVLTVGFVLFALFAAGATLLRAYTLLSAGTALSFGITANVARRLLRLPTSWFEKRTVGDVLSRFQSVEPIQQLLVEKAPAAIIDGVLALLTLGLMFVYSPTLAIIPLIGALAYAALQYATLGAERQTETDRIIATGKEQSMMIESIRGITTLRIAGRETMRQAAWQNMLSESLGAKYSHERIKAIQTTGGTLIGNVELVILIWASVTMVLTGGFSLGMTFAFIAYRLQFSTAIRSLIDAARDLGMIKLHLDRLSDIALTEEDIGYEEPVSPRENFRGEIELRNIIHAYGPHDPRVLDNVSLHIKQGEHVAITGSSGGGKSTLVRIILGLVDPDEGEVLIDGIPLKKYGRRSYRENVGAMLQDDVLFPGTIADNIAGFDIVDHDLLEESMAAACVLEDVNKMPMKHLTSVGDMGSNLSGGQKQRILLARALYRKPKLLIMDEGTAHLDIHHEKMVGKNIANLGITRIVIAHRQETIDAADRVIRLEGGKVS
jgi:ATP-binding cassette subfamily B protein RaxB